jgi:outer membrane murein-binding lipoprotein Lpp
MAQLNYNGSIFGNVNKVSFDGNEYSYNGILVASKLNQKNGQGYKLLDAIDIDWNKAWVSSLDTYLNTTEDLINALNDLNANSGVAELNKELQQVWNQINEITASYITHTVLGDILTTYQNKLVAGPNITIDEFNNINVKDVATYDYLSEFYVSNFKFQEYKDYISINYLDRIQTISKIEEITKEKIDEVINGADSAFDTLKEIADWILNQNRYEPVEPEYVIEHWGEYDFFTLDETTGSYVKVEKVEDVKTDGSVQYYKLENYLTDIKELIEDVDKLEETVGHSYIDNFGDIAYTGILGDVSALQGDVRRMKTDVEYAKDFATQADLKATEALTQSGLAYDMALSSYQMSEVSYGMAYEGLIQSGYAYDMAYYSYVAVGQPSFTGREWVKLEHTDILAYRDAGERIFYFNEETFQYTEETEKYNPEIEYFIYEGSVEATGLTKRVEDLEEDVDAIKEDIGDINTNIAASLYNLSVNNENSAYVKLNLSPAEFNGDPKRTLHIETLTSTFNPVTGEVTVPGLPDITTVCDIYSYMSSWQFLGYDETNNDDEQNNEL